MADTTTELEVLDEIVDVLGGQSGQYETVVPVLEDIRDLLGGGGGGGGYNPSLSVGRADALTGADETAQWAQSMSKGDGTATVRSVQGAAVVWNQLIKAIAGSASGWIVNGSTVVENDNSIEVTPTRQYGGIYYRYVSIIEGHKYLMTLDYRFPSVMSAGEFAVYTETSVYFTGITPITGTTNWQHGTAIATVPSNGASDSTRVFFQDNRASGWDTWSIKNVMLFDLTAMFGSGNEPTTVAEFERMYPAAYYPYSAPTLKPVQIAGIRSVGFNQWDEQWEVGFIDGSTGQPTDNEPMSIRSKNFCQCMPNTAYYACYPSGATPFVYWYDAAYGFISRTSVNAPTSPANAAYFKIAIFRKGATYQNNICINISNPARNGEYEPYRIVDSVEWTAQTLRAAGSVRDELTADELVTRVGVVDLGTLTWGYVADNAYFYAIVADKAKGFNNLRCAKYQTAAQAGVANLQNGQIVGGNNDSAIYIKDTAYTTAADFKVAMNGVLVFYELATPTTTPISPALPMTYRVEQGGTESIIVPDGEVSAAPIITLAEGESAADVVMDALACIATPDGPVATSNHAANTYLTMQGKLYKVTSAIAVGETIKSGTNVAETTVMAELIARTA